jgi:hypothetical protein
VTASCVCLSLAALEWGRWLDLVLCTLGVIGPFGLLLVVARLTDDEPG